MFELIQNAEDNRYTQAKRLMEDPFLSFTLHPDKIILESNEDGFAEENVKAICSVGQSTKKNLQGYIGEKGIGLKSVFKIARRVHIQSEPFSFFLEYNRDDEEDNGLKMIAPEWEDPQGLLEEHTRTRMTLILGNDGDFDELVADFSDLPKTYLMFLTQLKRICIKVIDSSGYEKTTNYSYQYDELNCWGTLNMRSCSNGVSLESISCYRVTKRRLANLPLHPARKHTRSAEVILSFPMRNENEILNEQQYVYAFLPLKQVGFNVRSHPFANSNAHADVN